MTRITIEHGSPLGEDGSVRVEVTSNRPIPVADIDHYAQRLWALVKSPEGPQTPLKVE